MCKPKTQLWAACNLNLSVCEVEQAVWFPNEKLNLLLPISYIHTFTLGFYKCINETALYDTETLGFFKICN